MPELRPCARCEEELPESAFASRRAVVCKRCAQEMEEVIRRKYDIIEAAHFRAQLRLKTRRLHKKAGANV